MVFLSIGFPLSSSRSLLLLNPVLLIGSKVVFTIFHSTLIGSKASIGGWKVLLQTLWKGIQGNHKRGQVEWNPLGTLVALPDQERLGRFWVLSRHLRLKSRGVAGIDLVIPSTTNAPLGRSAGIHDLACHLVCGCGLPTSWFEIQITNLTCRPVLDLHQSVVIHRRVSSDDAHDRGCNLFPSVELFTPGDRT